MEFVSYSSRRGRHLLHMCFKIKYCHEIFDDKTVQKRCEEIFKQVEVREDKFVIDEIGFAEIMCTLFLSLDRKPVKHMW